MSVVVSVIVPVYNAERTLLRCISSILAYSNCAIELILVDDGSMDLSGTICDKYAHDHECVRVIHQNNVGVSSARNAGIEIATGEWLTFVDSDDWIEREYLSSPIGSSADLVISSWRTNIDDFVEAEPKHEEYLPGYVSPLEIHNYIEDHMNSTMFRAPWGKFYRREIIDRYGIRFDSDIRLGEDTLFLLSYLKHVNSLYKASSGCYVYTACDFFSKYKLSAKAVGLYLDTFCKRYLDQPYRCGSFVFETIYVYSNVVAKKNIIDSILFSIRPSILELEWQYVSYNTLFVKAKWAFMKFLSLIWYDLLVIFRHR